MQILRKTIPNFIGAIVGALLFFILPFLIDNSYEVFSDYRERVSPQEDWYKYYSIEPVSPVFKKGDEIKFASKTEYFKDIDIAWQDTQYCITTAGNREKYTTQRWPEGGSEKRLAGTKVGFDPEEPDIWVYGFQPKDNAISCQMHSVVIGETPRGYEKVYEYLGDYYKVNE